MRTSTISTLVFLCLQILQMFSGHQAWTKALACGDPSYDKKRADIPEGKKRSRHHADATRKTASVSVLGKNKAVNFDHYRAKSQPSKGTVVFMCGGPGFSCMDDGRPASIPSDLDVIVFDYLGLGSNDHKVSNEEMSVEAQGDVVAGLVKSLKLKDYVLYGSSFGTSVATVAASRLGSDHAIAKPRLVVLDGVIGNPSFIDNQKIYSRSAERAWSLMNAKQQKNFIANYDRLTARMPPEVRRDFNSEILDVLSAGPKVASEILPEIVDPKPPKKADAGNPPMEKGLSPRAVHEYRVAGCQISTRALDFGKGKVFAGRVDREASKNTHGSICDCPLIHRPYDAKNFQIKDVPILYVNSDTDAQTPIEGAKYHQASQTQAAKKVFIEPHDMGHTEIEGALAGCGDLLWHSAIAGDIDSLEKNQAKIASGSCAGPSRGSRSRSIAAKTAR